jgi:hypothetical protein
MSRHPSLPLRLRHSSIHRIQASHLTNHVADAFNNNSAIKIYQTSRADLTLAASALAVA